MSFYCTVRCRGGQSLLTCQGPTTASISAPAPVSFALVDYCDSLSELWRWDFIVSSESHSASLNQNSPRTVIGGSSSPKRLCRAPGQRSSNPLYDRGVRTELLIVSHRVPGIKLSEIRFDQSDLMRDRVPSD